MVVCSPCAVRERGGFAFAGMTLAPVPRGRQTDNAVIPAKAGIQVMRARREPPACAGRNIARDIRNYSSLRIALTPTGISTS